VNAVIEMHDSECIAIEFDERGCGFVILDAYVHRGDGDDSMSPHEGGMQRIRIKAEDMTMEGAAGDLPARIYQGSLIVGAEMQGGIVRFPAAYTETFRLSMMLANDARVVVVCGKGLLIETEGEFRFVETVDFSSRKG
jgi:hypothetical protein